MKTDTAKDVEIKQLRDTLQWYAKQAWEITIAVLADQTQTMTSVMKVLALDAGRRASAVLPMEKAA